MPTTEPTYGWPLPVLADPPDGPAQMTALAAGIAADLDNIAHDGEQETIAAPVPWDGSIIVYRIGRVIAFHILLNRSTNVTINGGDFTLGTITNLDLRPVHSVYIPCITTNSSSVVKSPQSAMVVVDAATGSIRTQTRIVDANAMRGNGIGIAPASVIR